MSYDITRLLRHAPLGELGPTTWRAAEIIEDLTEQVKKLHEEIKVLKQQIETIKYS